MNEKEIFSIEYGEVCEYGKAISKERIVTLLNEAEFIRNDLQTEKNINSNLRASLTYFRNKCLRLENGVKDCVQKRDDLKKFAKRMGVI